MLVILTFILYVDNAADMNDIHVEIGQINSSDCYCSIYINAHSQQNGTADIIKKAITSTMYHSKKEVDVQNK
jgi:hypothetical protein